MYLNHRPDYAHHIITCPLYFSDLPTALSNTKCRQKFQSGWPLSGLWLMSRINDYLKELEQYITHSKLTNETRLAVTKRAQKWIVHSVSCCLNLLFGSDPLEVYTIRSLRFQVKITAVFPRIVSAETILSWIFKTLKTSYSFPIKFSLMEWELE